jgi:hypothetical protein
MNETLTNLAEGYTVDERGIIRSPGKFEGESVSILYWYDAMMNGDGEPIEPDDDDDYDADSCEDGDDEAIGCTFDVTPEECDLLALDTNTVRASLYYSEAGFVSLEYDVDNSCDQCNAAMINRVFCHETGCPNRRKVKLYGVWEDDDTDDEF